MKKDDAQAALDIEDTSERLAVISRALAHVEECESIVTSLKNQLAQAKIRLRDAKWDANARIRQMTTRLRPTRSKPSDRPNGQG